MKQNFVKEIAIRDKVIDRLEQEVRLKNELIQAQNERIKTLEDHNRELQKMIETVLTLKPEQKG